MQKPLLTSCLCTYDQWETEWLPHWREKIKDPPQVIHRKLWEWCFIAQALYEREMLHEGRKGLGFAVGKEPLSPLFASCGCEILATDLHYEQSQKRGWVDTNQHADRLADLNERRICDPSELQKLVSFRHVNMNKVPDDLQGFDFLWSCCAIEHLGSIRKGLNFVYNAMKCLRPGGIAVHTTDFNISSNTGTINHQRDVLFRKHDIENFVWRLTDEGHATAALNFDTGSTEADHFISQPPYTQDPIHLKFQAGPYIATSIGLIIQKGEGTQKRSIRRKLWERLRTFVAIGGDSANSTGRDLG